MNRNLATLAATGAALWVLHSPAQAVVHITVLQQGPDVGASFSGSLDLDSFSGPPGILPLFPFVGSNGYEGLVLGGAAFPAQSGPGLASIFVASTSAVGGFAAPLTPNTSANASSGDIFGLVFGGTDPAINLNIAVPSSYRSGDPLSGGATWSSRTLANLGLNPGTYTFTWGADANVESLELQIGAAPVPEPATLALMLAGIAAVGAIAGRQGARRA